MTRAVNDLVYRVPSDTGTAGSTGSSLEDETVRAGNNNNNNNNQQQQPPGTGGTNGTGGQHYNPFTAGTDLGRLDDECSMSAERWPIPLEPVQMNPKLLLGYACERIMLQGCVAHHPTPTA